MTDCIAPEVARDIATKDLNRVVNGIAKSLAYNAPYVNVIKGGNFPSGVSDNQRSVIQEEAAPGDSLTVPTFSSFLEACGQCGAEDQTGTLEFTYSLEYKRGRGPKVCVAQAYSAYKDSYIRAQQSLTDNITQYINADVRAQLYLRSGSKFVANSVNNFDLLYTGGIGQISVGFTPNYVPDAPLSFQAVSYISRYLKEHLLATPEGSGSDIYFSFIGSLDQIEYFRNELDVKAGIQSLTEGGFKFGETSLKGYKWEGPYRGVKFGVDQRPLRFNEMVDGVPVLIEPVVIEQTSKGLAARPNLEWMSALNEISMLMVSNGAFERLVPEKYTGEGTFKFAQQLHMGDLKWHYVEDNGANSWGDYGWHQYQITRAYRPVRPWWVIPMAHRRCFGNLGLAACASSTSNSI